MRNAAFQSFSSEFCNLGNNDVQMLNSDISMPLDRLNVYGGSFQIDSQMSNNDQLGPFGQLRSAEIPEPFNYVTLPGFLSTTSIYENTCYQPIFPNKRLPTPQQETGFEAIPNVRKRSVRVGDRISKEKTVKEWKKTKALCTEEPSHYRAIEQPWETQELRVPLRRSQKLGDRITALQKLVSPFGKTDTASVLQEASVCIKLLQEQIQMLSTPYFRVKPLHQQSFGEKQVVDLRSRGLCLVPVSFTQTLAKEDRADHALSIRRDIIPGNY
ncbi:hypothetical protein HHK36_018377 [Tetracentron sinense]|uniref:BHLH domain-containing protein n=1 Tax=Tetracentron sinense TaxID=13715 RepID=A0A834YYL4_TETSI|nr:hypothetical protein HHK36_018377 [Tetracentron sinense]